jgi:hypothetical protein
MFTATHDDSVLDDRCDVILRGQVVCDEEDGEFVQDWIAARVRRLDPNMFLDAALIADPLARPEDYDRPLYERVTLRPVENVASVSNAPIFNWQPPRYVRAAVWLGIFAVIFRACSDLALFSPDFRRGASIFGMTLFAAPTIVLIPSLQPAQLVTHVLATFDFWYVAVHLLCVCYIEALGLQTLHRATSENAAIHAAMALSLIAGFVAADSFAMTSTAKAGRYLILFFHCVAQAMCWMFGHDHRDDTVNLFVFESTVGALAQTLYGGVGAYMLRAIVGTLGGQYTPPFRPVPCAKPVN